MIKVFLASILVAASAALVAVATPAAANTNWTGLTTLNITHQGGENEAPSNTMYALKRSMRLGADMLEVDIHTSSDDELIVIHDGTVDRTTNGSGSVYEMTLAEIKALDSAYNLVPGDGARADHAPEEYPFRGVRTGEVKPPPSFGPEDFTIPTLDELFKAFPGVPINIEIKGASDTNVESFSHNAEVLAEYLNASGRSDGIVVASFNDAAVQYFHQLAPQIDLAPAVAGVAAYKLAGVPPTPGTKVFQVPIEFSGVSVTDEAFIEKAHSDGFGVHVWTVNDPDEIKMLLDWDVDGIMTAEPMRLERVLCKSGVERPAAVPPYQGRHCSRRASIACDVSPSAAELGAKGRLKVTLTRADEFDSRCAGRVAVGSQGRKGRQVSHWRFGWKAPSDGGPSTKTVRVKLNRELRNAFAAGKPARLAARPYGAFVQRARLRVK